jgi:hypothetical protein
MNCFWRVFLYKNHDKKIKENGFDSGHLFFNCPIRPTQNAVAPKYLEII